MGSLVSKTAADLLCDLEQFAETLPTSARDNFLTHLDQFLCQQEPLTHCNQISMEEVISSQSNKD